MAQEYDVVILGGGTGGYVAAIRASQLGLKTAIVEKDKLGGTCLHKGCIPSKALLRSAEVYQTARKSAVFGIVTKEVSVDFAAVQSRKAAIVDKLYKGVRHLMKKGSIDVFHGTGRILGPSIFSPLPGTISVEMNDSSENEMLVPKNVIIATGSRPRLLPGIEADGQTVLTSDEALAMEQLPASIIIIGGGVIGIEWASLLADFGTKVTIIEYGEQIVPTEDQDVAKELARQLRNKDVQIVTGARVLPETLEKGETVSVSADINGQVQTFRADKLLVSVGRQANVEGIGIENTSIELENNIIKTNQYYQTNESHIYAVGDVIGGLQLAHVASREGLIAVEHIAGRKPRPLVYQHVPACIYSSPQAASVGFTEKEAIETGFSIKTGKFPFTASGKALVFGETDGFVKIIADKATDDILGIHMIGPHVTELISEAGLAKVLDATPWEIGQMVHPHPTLSETIGEAALAVDGNALHS
ncbi:dihydrolipoyl dehydrogenase [Bacillaceae bacterium Marseille-Q3522]|nr:dihydrolipoyl dehydrogenase [Bacillaceae bacterium Marseille-Q3522]